MKWLAMLVAVLMAKEGVANTNVNTKQLKDKNAEKPTADKTNVDLQSASDSKTSATNKANKATANLSTKRVFPDQTKLFTSHNEKEDSFFLPINKNLILDPAFATDAESINILSNLYEPLVYFDANNKLVAGAAKSYQVSKDGKQWIFRLSKNAKWSDGTKVTAYDFVYAWRRLVDPAMQAPNRFILQQANILNAAEIISGEKSVDQLGVIALNDNELLVVLDKPTPWLLSILDSQATAPLKVAKYFNTNPDEHHVAHTEIISNGAYKFSLADNKRFMLEKNPHYAYKDQVHISRIYGYQDSVMSANLNNNNVSGLNVFYVNNQDLAKVASEYPNQLVTKIFPESRFLEINMEDRIMSKKQVRQALNLLIDRASLARDIYDSTVPTTLLTPPVVTDAGQIQQNEKLLTNTKENFAQALKLLSELKYSKQNPLILKFIYSLDNNDENSYSYYDVLIRQLNDNSGGVVKIEAVGLSTADYFTALRKGDYQFTSITWKATYNHASAFYDILTSNSGDNFAGYNSFVYDVLINKAYVQNDPKKRVELFAQANNLLNEDLPVIPLLWKASHVLVDPRLKNFDNNSFNILVKNMYFDDRGYKQLLAQFDQKSIVKVQLASKDRDPSVPATAQASEAPTTTANVNTYVFTLDVSSQQKSETLLTLSSNAPQSTDTAINQNASVVSYFNKGIPNPIQPSK